MSNLATPAAVRTYWLEQLAPKDWFVASDAVDDAIRAAFLPTWEIAQGGGCRDWLETPEDLLAYLVLTDQFPRNMFRGDGRSFATDNMAVAAADLAIAKGWDMDVPEPARQFIYVPYMHAECLAAQDKAIAYFETRMPETGHNNIEHAHAHRWVIAKYGRFPYRNAALGRETKPDEQAFLDAGGYGHAVKQVRSTD